MSETTDEQTAQNLSAAPTGFARPVGMYPISP